MVRVNRAESYARSSRDEPNGCRESASSAAPCGPSNRHANLLPIKPQYLLMADVGAVTGAQFELGEARRGGSAQFESG